MSVNFGGPRGPPFPGPIGVGTPPSGRFRNMYQQSPPPSIQGRGSRNERAVTFMPNDVKIPRQPKQPDKPLPAYMRYSRKVWEKVKAQHPEMKMWDIGKLIGEQWRNLPEDERQGFFAEYEVEKCEYQEAMKVYHNSSAYRDWLKAKEKAQQAIQEQQMCEKMIGTQLPKEENRFMLQQIEEEDDDDFSSKHVATARFQRNHKLIAEIFNETTVPDIKSIVTRPRLENLKKQVQSLMQHQKKLEIEIQDMEGNFEAKKAKIMKQSEDFEEKVKKLSEPPKPLVIPLEDEKMETADEPTSTDTNMPTKEKMLEQTLSPNAQLIYKEPGSNTSDNTHTEKSEIVESAEKKHKEETTIPPTDVTSTSTPKEIDPLKPSEVKSPLEIQSITTSAAVTKTLTTSLDTPAVLSTPSETPIGLATTPTRSTKEPSKPDTRDVKTPEKMDTDVTITSG